VEDVPDSLDGDQEPQGTPIFLSAKGLELIPSLSSEIIVKRWKYKECS